MNLNSTLIDYLEDLSKTPNSRLIIIGERGWFVVQSYDIPARVLCEAATNTHLPEELRIPKDKEQFLTNANYTSRRGKRSIGKMVTLKERRQKEELSNEILTLLKQVYGEESPEFKMQTNVRSGVTNNKLHTKIRILSRERTMKSRQDFYKAVVTTTLLLAMENDAPKAFGSLGPYVSYGAFTDDKAIRTWDPRGVDYKKIPGKELFPLLKSLDAGSLFINPQGDIGGELYRNEIESLCEGIKKLKL